MTYTAPQTDWNELAATMPSIDEAPTKPATVTVVEVQVEGQPGARHGGELFEVDVFMTLSADAVEAHLASWVHNRYGAAYRCSNYHTTQNVDLYRQTERYEDEF